MPTPPSAPGQPGLAASSPVLFHLPSDAPVASNEKLRAFEESLKNVQTEPDKRHPLYVHREKMRERLVSIGEGEGYCVGQELVLLQGDIDERRMDMPISKVLSENRGISRVLPPGGDLATALANMRLSFSTGRPLHPADLTPIDQVDREIEDRLTELESSSSEEDGPPTPRHETAEASTAGRVAGEAVPVAQSAAEQQSARAERASARQTGGVGGEQQRGPSVQPPLPLRGPSVQPPLPSPPPLQPPPPPLELLRWRLSVPTPPKTPDAPLPIYEQCRTACLQATGEGPLAVSRRIYDAAVVAGQLIVRSPEEQRRVELDLKSTTAAVREIAKSSSSSGQLDHHTKVDWHETRYVRGSQLEQARICYTFTTPFCCTTDGW